MIARSSKSGWALALSSAVLVASSAALAQTPAPAPAPAPAQPAAPPATPPAPAQPAAPPPGMTPAYPPGALPPGVSPMPGSRLPPPYGYYPYPYPYPYAQGPLAPREIEWETGEPIPPGYHVSTKPRFGLVVAGAVTLGSIWVLNGIPAIIGTAGGDGGAAALFAPVVGPFIAIGTLRAEGAGVVALLADGIAQTAGLALLIAGIAAPKSVLVRNDIVSRILPAPVLLPNGNLGLGFTGKL